MAAITKQLTVKSQQGLHARPAAMFVQVANRFDAMITVKKGKQKVNGKSIMGILMLAAGEGSQITVEADGDDAEQALLELEKIVSKDE
ncbi:MAG: HPr family phosphocarrier protein [Candidatus Omnitrophota bacterium]|nr:HPr family phosphocarrier protein [Candidatus Omnitrophota bacterium]